MFTQDTRLKSATRVKAKEIPIYYSSALRIRPKAKIVIVMLVAAMFGTIVGMSVARAETVETAGDIPMIVARQSAPRGPADHRGPPPREAIAACANQTAQSACSFSGRDNQNVQGTCLAPESDVPLACVPADMPQKG
jgi:hypothetical protein